MIEEYQTLRDEAISHIETLNHYQLTTILAVVGFVGLDVLWIKSSPYLFLVPVLVVFTNGINYANRSEAVRRIGTYIEVFIEPHVQNLKWQRRRYRLGAIRGSSGFDAKWLRVIYTGNFLVFGGLCTALFWHKASPQSWVDMTIAGIASAMLIFMEYRLMLPGSARKDIYLRDWRRIQDEEGEGS